jgi:hypothetical protein
MIFELTGAATLAIDSLPIQAPGAIMASWLKMRSPAASVNAESSGVLLRQS